MFVSDETESAIYRRVHDMKAPGGATAVYDQTTGTLIMVVAQRESAEAEPKLIRWVMNGPMTLEEAKQEIHEAGLQSGFPGMPSEPISIN